MKKQDIYWEMAKQDGRLIGSDTKNGIEYSAKFYPTWQKYRDDPDMRLQAKHVQHGKDPRYTQKVETKLDKAPDRMTVTSKNKEKVHDYAKRFREVMKERAKPTGKRGVRHGRTVQL